MEEEPHYSQAVFWIDLDKIRPNPYQPRREFDDAALNSLAESIRQYGVLQPIVVTRQEKVKEDGGMETCYELVAGERRLRAARIAGLIQIPALIREKEDNDKVKLEIAIIENIQREDLNPVDRARAFAQLATEFSLTHADIAKKIGKSREYVSNSIRLLALPEEMLTALLEKKISEGHTRPILMLNDRKPEQYVLFQEILNYGLTVRDAESISRRMAKDKVRRPGKIFDRETMMLEEQLAEKLGTRVRIEKREKGGKILIDFFSSDDLDNILNAIDSENNNLKTENTLDEDEGTESYENKDKENEEDLYSISNFSV